MGVQELWQSYRERRTLLKRAKAFSIHPSEQPPSEKASSKTASKIPIPIPEPHCISCSHLCPQSRVLEGVRHITADSEPRVYWEEDCQKWLQVYLVTRCGMAKKEARLLGRGFVGRGTAMFKWRLDWRRDMLGPKQGQDVFCELAGWELEREVKRRLREE